MRRIALFLSLAALTMLMASCEGSTEKKSTETTKVEVAETAKVTVYYFHGKQRCKTCIGIQNVAQEAIAETYGDIDDVVFIEVDFSEKANAALADKYEVAYSSLIVASGNEHTNLTDFAFANVNSNPEELKETLVAEVNSFLNQ